MSSPPTPAPEVRHHLHAIVGLAERILSESQDVLAAELATAICHQSRFLLAGGSIEAVEAQFGDQSPPIAEPTDPGPGPANPVDEPAYEGVVVDQSVLSTLAEEIGSPDIVGTLVETFLGELDERISAIVNGVDNRGEEACRAAHTLKGTAATMGAVELTEISSELELLFRSGEGDVATLAARLPSAGIRCRDALNEVVNSMTIPA